MLSQEQVDQYKRDGYCVYPSFLEKQGLSELLGEVSEVCAGATLGQHDKERLEMEPKQPPEGTSVRRLYEPCTHYPRARALSESAKLLDTVEQLLGPNLLFHYSKLNMKPAAVGSVVEWHQDLSYYPLTNRDSLAILFYLDDTDLSNGCLQVIPGKQNDSLLKHTRDGIFQGKITEPVDESKAVAVSGSAGTAIFMSGMTPHSSAPNTSARSRRTLILSYRAADAYPIYIGESTTAAETYVRLVRGERFLPARLSADVFPIPRYPQKTKSLYELQELSREELPSAS